MARIPSYDDLAPSIPDVSPGDVFASVERLLPQSGPVAIADGAVRPAPAVTVESYACVRSARTGDAVMDLAREFSPRLQRYGAGCVVLDISGLGRLLGDSENIARELARAAARQCGWASMDGVERTPRRALRAAPRFTSRYGIRIEPHPAEHAAVSRQLPTSDADGRHGDGGSGDRDPRARDGDVRCPPGFRIAVAPTQISALLVSLGGSPLTVIGSDAAAALAMLPIHVLQQLMADVHGVSVLRGKAKAADAVRDSGVWPPWAACIAAFDVLRRWGLKTLGELAALPAGALSARMGGAGVRLQQLARGLDPRPLVPDPDVPRFVQRIELEWPIDGLEPLSFVLARLLDPLSSTLERADRAAAAVRLDLRLVDRSAHGRVLQLPAALRDPRVLRTLLLLDLESHPPAAAIDVVTIEIDPAPGRVLQYSLVERPLPSPETLATLAARLGALVGDERCGAPVLLDTVRPDAFELQRFAPADVTSGPSVQRLPAPGSDSAVAPCLRRFRPPVAIRVSVERGRPVHVAIDRRGMPGGHVEQAAGPWRSSGDWWAGDKRRWGRDEWDVAFSDGPVCRLFRERGSGRWFMDGVLD